MVQIVILTGHLLTGKTALAERLEADHGFHIVRTSQCVRDEFERRGETNFSRSNLQDYGNRLDDETSGKWLRDLVVSAIETGSNKLVVDHVRNSQQLDHFRQNPSWATIHVHLYAPHPELKEQFGPKSRQEQLDYEAADPIESEDDIEAFKMDADVRINVSRTDAVDTYTRVAARLRLYSNPFEQCVDVLIGGQFGSEGKGHIAASIARHYDLVIRVGGPNAGHTVSSPSGTYTYHQLPSGSKDLSAKLLLGPGMTIDKGKLLEEIQDCEVTEDRLCIDPQAIVITDDDKKAEQVSRAEIASTASGSGAAASRRIMGRTSNPPVLAKDDPDLKKYTKARPAFCGDAVRELERCYSNGKKVLLEGTQGSGLSIFNGQYPYVTSRDTNVAGCLAEVGISPKRVRRIVMVVRTTPIRVGNPDGGKHTSGPLKKEITFDVVAAQAGLNATEVKEAEKTSTTKRNRRVAWFDWELFRRSCMINTPTDIALTFVDYLDEKNRAARRFEQLTDDTIKFIQELEHIAQAPVSIINTRFQSLDDGADLRSMIDRRDWS